MRLTLSLFFVVLAMAGGAFAQDGASDLDVTLPTGKVVHFQTEEQKDRFMAARAAQAAKVQQAQAQAAAEHTPKPFVLGQTALDDKPLPNGKVNPTAPTFTADYYMPAPETWAGKQINLSVASLQPQTMRTARTDGLQALMAQTYNDLGGNYNGQRFGGSIVVLAKPEIAARLMVQCGTNIRYVADRLQTTLIKGEIRKLDDNTAMGTTLRQYGFFVDK